MRCPRCGASNLEGADWCSQCLMRFGAPIVQPEPAVEDPPKGRSGGDGAARIPSHPPDLRQTVAVRLQPSERGGIRRVDGRLEWTCRACATVNPVDDVACRVCGTSMMSLFRPPEVARIPRDPNVALGLSVIPGLGTWYAGSFAQGLARFLLWLWWLGVTALFWPRPQPAFLVVKLPFAAGVAALWALSAADARRLAQRRRPLLDGRALAIAAAGLSLLLVVGLLVLAGLVRGVGG